MPNELPTKTHVAKHCTSGKSSNRDELREGDEAAQHGKSHRCTVGATEQSRDQRHPRAHWRIKSSGTCPRQFCASFLFSLVCASCRWWWRCVFLRSISVWKVLFSLKCCFIGAHVAPQNFFFQDCFFRTLFSHRCESSAMTFSSCIPLFKEMHNSHVSHMVATKVFRAEILEPLFAESDDGKVSADAQHGQNSDASQAVCQVRGRSCSSPPLP